MTIASKMHNDGLFASAKESRFSGKAHRTSRSQGSGTGTVSASCSSRRSSRPIAAGLLSLRQSNHEMVRFAQNWRCKVSKRMVLRGVAAPEVELRGLIQAAEARKKHGAI